MQNTIQIFSNSVRGIVRLKCTKLFCSLASTDRPAEYRRQNQPLMELAFE